MHIRRIHREKILPRGAPQISAGIITFNIPDFCGETE